MTWMRFAGCAPTSEYRIRRDSEHADSAGADGRHVNSRTSHLIGTQVVWMKHATTISETSKGSTRPFNFGRKSRSPR